MNEKLMDVAIGKQPADLIITGGRVINVLTGEIYFADISVSDGRIAAVGKLAPGAFGEKTRIVNANGNYLVPGFIDAHIHFESSMLTFRSFNRLVLPHGTTVIASDVMEISIVSGYKAIQEVFREAEGLPVKLVNPVLAVSELDDSLQTVGDHLSDDVLEEMISTDHAVGFAELMPDFILQRSGQARRLWNLARQYGKTLEGHCPGLSDPELSAYASVGIRSDHECVTREEAREKLRHGLHLLIREGSASQDLAECIKVITEDGIDARYCSLVSDDIDMEHIFTYGHMDYKVRMAVKAGVDPVTAIQMVTINPAESLKIDDRYGSLTPGKCADIVILTDLSACSVRDVIANGTVVVSNGKVDYAFDDFRYAPFMENTVHLQKPVTAEDLRITAPAKTTKARVRVMQVSGRSLYSEAKEAVLPVIDGGICCNEETDVMYAACVERYGKNGGIGKAFISGFGFTRSSIASSVGHDHHNITVIGKNLEDMALCVNRIAETGGGLVIAENGEILFELPLPICGLLATMDGEEAAVLLARMQQYLREQGCGMMSPFMSLSFATLPIPDYAITDKGLIEVKTLSVRDPVLEWV